MYKMRHVARQFVRNTGVRNTGIFHNVNISLFSTTPKNTPIEEEILDYVQKYKKLPFLKSHLDIIQSRDDKKSPLDIFLFQFGDFRNNQRITVCPFDVFLMQFEESMRGQYWRSIINRSRIVASPFYITGSMLCFMCSFDFILQLGYGNDFGQLLLDGFGAWTGKFIFGVGKRVDESLKYIFAYYLDKTYLIPTKREFMTLDWLSYLNKY